MKVNNNIIDKIISLKLNTLNDLKQKKSLSDLIDEVKNILKQIYIIICK